MMKRRLKTGLKKKKPNQFLTKMLTVDAAGGGDMIFDRFVKSKAKNTAGEEE